MKYQVYNQNELLSYHRFVLIYMYLLIDWVTNLLRKKTVSMEGNCVQNPDM